MNTANSSVYAVQSAPFAAVPAPIVGAGWPGTNKPSWNCNGIFRFTLEEDDEEDEKETKETNV
jgi:hypothetical protein